MANSCLHAAELYDDGLSAREVWDSIAQPRIRRRRFATWCEKGNYWIHFSLVEARTAGGELVARAFVRSDGSLRADTVTPNAKEFLEKWEY